MPNFIRLNIVLNHILWPRLHSWDNAQPHIPQKFSQTAQMTKYLSHFFSVLLGFFKNAYWAHWNQVVMCSSYQKSHRKEKTANTKCNQNERNMTRKRNKHPLDDFNIERKRRRQDEKSRYALYALQRRDSFIAFGSVC